MRLHKTAPANLLALSHLTLKKVVSNGEVCMTRNWGQPRLIARLKPGPPSPPVHRELNAASNQSSHRGELGSRSFLP